MARKEKDHGTTFHRHTMIPILKRDSACPALPAGLYRMYRHKRPHAWSRFSHLFRCCAPRCLGTPAGWWLQRRQRNVATYFLPMNKGRILADAPVTHSTGSTTSAPMVGGARSNDSKARSSAATGNHSLEGGIGRSPGGPAGACSTTSGAAASTGAPGSAHPHAASRTLHGTLAGKQRTGGPQTYGRANPRRPPWRRS